MEKIYKELNELQNAVESKINRTMAIYKMHLMEINNYLDKHNIGDTLVGEDLKALVSNDIENIRICSYCSKPMASGYCIDNGMEYYCSDECLHEIYTEEEWKNMYGEDNYYTEWESVKYE